MKIKLKYLAVALCMMTSLYAQNKDADPYKANAKKSKTPEQKVERVHERHLSICYEDFSLPLAMAAKLQREDLGDAELYERLVAALDTKEVQQEGMIVIHTYSGSKATTKGITEWIYPTDYVSSKTESFLSGSQAAIESKNTAELNAAPAPALPTHFEVKPLGLYVEVEPTLGEHGKRMDLRINVERIAMVENSVWGQGISTVEIPTFEVQAVKTQVVCEVNQPCFLGTINRTPNSKINPDSSDRVWYAFVTAKAVLKSFKR